MGPPPLSLAALLEQLGHEPRPARLVADADAGALAAFLEDAGVEQLELAERRLRILGPKQLGANRLGVVERLQPRREAYELVAAEVALLDPSERDNHRRLESRPRSGAQARI